MSDARLQTTVGGWVTEHPQTSRVFEALRIDYCCGGGRPLQEACRERNLDAGGVLEQLQQAIDAAGSEPQQNWADAPLAELCDHIEQTHHDYLRAELPRLAGMIAKVVAAHGNWRPEMAEVQRVFAELKGELEPHMLKEEMVLFPAIRQLEQASSPPAFPFGSIANPIRMMEHEHDAAGQALSDIRRLTEDYTVPEGACNTYRAMLAGLCELEQDMHRHVHKENYILFPRAIEMESTRLAGGGTLNTQVR